MQSFLTLALTLAVACFTLCNGDDVQYQCLFDSTTEELSMVLRTPYEAGVTESITAIDVTNNAARGCRSTATVTVDTIDYLELVIVTDSDSVQQQPSDSCFVVEEPAGSDVLNYAIVIESVATFMRGSDPYYTFICDPATALGDVFTIPNQQITVANFVTNNNEVLTESGQSVSIALKTTNGLQATGSANLGDNVLFEITYARDAAPTVPLFIQVGEITVHDSATFDGNSEPMLTLGGCLPPSNGIFDLVGPFTVQGAGSLDPSVNTTVVATSGAFEVAVFDSANELHFEIVLEEGCYSLSEDRCFDPAAFCAVPPAGGRRKRSVTDQTRNTTTVRFTLPVNVGGLSNPGGEIEKNVSEKECEAMTSFWIVSIVLGVLLLVVLVFAVMLFYRLKREQGKKQVDGERFGTKNPTF